MNSICFILQCCQVVMWDKCPGLCTCPTLVAICPTLVATCPTLVATCPTLVATCPGQADKH